MSTVLDYVGRTVDVVCYHGATLNSKRLLTQSLGDSNGDGKVCTGVVKLAQRFLLELLTEQGSMPFLPTRGCTFMTEARLGYFRNQVDILAAFSRARVIIKRNMQQEESDTDPDDERYGTAVVTNIEYTPGHAEIYITLVSRARTTTPILPIKVAL